MWLVENMGKIGSVAVGVRRGTRETGWVVLGVKSPQHGTRDTRRGGDGGRTELGA